MRDSAWSGRLPEDHKVPTPAEARELLREGNLRYAQGNIDCSRYSQERRRQTSLQGQRPFAITIGCSDSRSPLEMVFGQGLGDLFVIRTAGNLCGSFTIASLELAIVALETPYLVVVGHSECGAVKATLNRPPYTSNSLDELFASIKPSVEEALRNDPALEGDQLVSEVVRLNARNSLRWITDRSQLIRSRIESGQLQAEYAVLDLLSGLVHWQ